MLDRAEARAFRSEAMGMVEALADWLDTAPSSAVRPVVDGRVLFADPGVALPNHPRLAFAFYPVDSMRGLDAAFDAASPIVPDEPPTILLPVLQGDSLPRAARNIRLLKWPMLHECMHYLFHRERDWRIDQPEGDGDDYYRNMEEIEVSLMEMASRASEFVAEGADIEQVGDLLDMDESALARETLKFFYPSFAESLHAFDAGHVRLVEDWTCRYVRSELHGILTARKEELCDEDEDDLEVPSPSAVP